ncbi:MAG: hypothetical protein HYY65_03155 [Candidatus Tectomicrobia bacterium]|uniref:Uncharacterized protein n=1 Tax=Tectimicrobiota bacterium TaxID=2528274 RepID=A0A932GN67_UNCTE|nr:hypothetical protein [Candidatus Tectomicrobia bacterium]
MKRQEVPPEVPRKGTRRPRKSLQDPAREIRQKEESFWVQRHDTRRELQRLWNIVAFQPTRREGRGRRCGHVSNGEQCTYLRVASSTQRAPIPPWCRFHLATMLAEELAPLLKGDPEAITEDFAVGCLEALVDERLRGGPTAQEAQEALRVLCNALLAWSPMNQDRETGER